MIDNNLIHIENSALTNTSQRLNTLIGSFINSQDVKDSSKALYKRTISQYFKWIDRNKFKQNEITRAEVLKYKQELLESGMSSLTVGSYITVVRKFYEWTEANKLYPNVAKNIKTPRRKQQFKKQSLTDSQAKSLLDHYKNKQFEALRDYAVISLLLRTGLRTVELIRANIEDVTMKEGKRILYIQGKGRDEKDNFVVITGKAFEPIEE